MKSKLIAIVGPTATGKSDLAIKLAKKFKGEIISADSRQVYKGLDIGSGKVSKKEQRIIPHHLLDVVSPKKQFSASQFKLLTKKTIVQIVSSGKVPFLVGGTPFYIYTVIDDLEFPEVAPNNKLRAQLSKKTTAQLFAVLKRLDPKRASSIDKNNPHRLIRAIEIVKTTGRAVPDSPFLKKNSPYNILILGMQKDPEELKSLIHKRLSRRIKQGLIAEVRNLKKKGVSHNRLVQFGLEYRFVAEYIKGVISLDEMKTQLESAINKFSKRQMTWFKQDSRINWVNNQSAAEKLIQKFLLK